MIEENYYNATIVYDTCNIKVKITEKDANFLYDQWHNYRWWKCPRLSLNYTKCGKRIGFMAVDISKIVYLHISECEGED